MKRVMLAAVLLCGCWAAHGATTFMALENMARTTLSAELTGSALTISVTDGSVFPASGQFLVTVFVNQATAYEIILCDSVSGNTITVNASGRAQQGTSAATWASGAYIQQALTAGEVEDIHDAINAIEDGATELAKVDLPDNGQILLGTDDDYKIDFNGTYLRIMDAANNVFFRVTDNGGTGTLRFDSNMSAGVEDTTLGLMRLFGTATTNGGRLEIDNAADSDSTINIWELRSISGDLKLQRDTTDVLTVDDATGDMTFAADLIQGTGSRNKMRSAWIPASAMAVLSGSVAAGEYASSGGDEISMAFDPDVDGTVSFMLAWPDYSGDDLDVMLVWGGTAAGNVEWNVYCATATDTTAVPTTAHEIIDGYPGASMVGSPSVTVTPDSAADSDKLLFFHVARDADDGTNDTNTGDAELLGVMVSY